MQCAVCIVYNVWCKICFYCSKLIAHGSYGRALGHIFIFIRVQISRYRQGERYRAREIQSERESEVYIWWFENMFRWKVDTRWGDIGECEFVLWAHPCIDNQSSNEVDTGHQFNSHLCKLDEKTYHRKFNRINSLESPNVYNVNTQWTMNIIEPLNTIRKCEKNEMRKCWICMSLQNFCLVPKYNILRTSYPYIGFVFTFCDVSMLSYRFSA